MEYYWRQWREPIVGILIVFGCIGFWFLWKSTPERELNPITIESARFKLDGYIGEYNKLYATMVGGVNFQSVSVESYDHRDIVDLEAYGEIGALTYYNFDLYDVEGNEVKIADVETYKHDNGKWGYQISTKKGNQHIGFVKIELKDENIIFKVNE